jgi:hypothetical protein
MMNLTGSPDTAIRVGLFVGNLGGNAGKVLVPLGMRAYFFTRFTKGDVIYETCI